MESKGIDKHTKTNVLQTIDDWYIKESEDLLSRINYGVKSDKKTDIEKYKFLKAFDNILCRNMKCDLKVTDELLEAVSLYTKTSTFKYIK